MKKFQDLSVETPSLANQVLKHGLKCDVYGYFCIAADPDDNVEK